MCVAQTICIGGYWLYIVLVCHLEQICDMIKRNELDVGTVLFDILAKIVFKFVNECS